MSTMLSQTQFLDAVKKNNTDLVKKVLENEPINIDKALEQAVLDSNVEMIALLIENGAKISLEKVCKENYKVKSESINQLVSSLCENGTPWEHILDAYYSIEDDDRNFDALNAIIIVALSNKSKESMENAVNILMGKATNEDVKDIYDLCIGEGVDSYFLEEKYIDVEITKKFNY